VPPATSPPPGYSACTLTRIGRRSREYGRRLVEAVRGLLRFALRMLVIKGELEREDGSARDPMLAQIKVTNRCNMRCRMCGQWGETGYHREFEGKETVELDVARRFVDQLAPLKIDLTLWGGEPLVYPQLTELLEHAQDQGVGIGIITNGLTLEKHADLLVRTGVKELVVSLDAPPAVHDDIRGVEGAFDRVVAGMRAVIEARRRYGVVRPHFRISSVVSEDTWPHLEAFHDHLASLDLGIRTVVSTLRWWTDEETGREYEEEMQRTFGCEAPSWRGFRLDSPPEVDSAAVAEAFARIRKRRYPFKTFFHPKLTPEQLAVFFANTTISFGRNTCVGPWIYALLLPTGELTFCPDFPDYRFGSLKDAELGELWNGERARAFRRKIVSGLLPICPRCCGLYVAGTPQRFKPRAVAPAPEIPTDAG